MAVELSVTPVCHNIVAKTPRIHMRNAYKLNLISQKHNETITLGNPRIDRDANLEDVVALMLLEVQTDDNVEVKFFVEKNDVVTNLRISRILEEIEDILLTP
tara:strand:+ start:249 stop:554 length:306 start_codon:yes stop_codon:yes gene_type:complete